MWATATPRAANHDFFFSFAFSFSQSLCARFQTRRFLKDTDSPPTVRPMFAFGLSTAACSPYAMYLPSSVASISLP